MSPVGHEEPEWISAQLCIVILVDEWKEFLRRSLIRSVFIPKFANQHSFFHPDPIEDYRNQEEHDQETIQTRDSHWHANTDHDKSQVDWMAGESIDPMCNESVITPYDQCRRIEPPQCSGSNEIEY